MEEKTQPVTIIISDDEDEETANAQPLPTARVVTIVIPDDDPADEETEEVSGTMRNVYGPMKNFKVSEENIKKLRASVKVEKLDLASSGKIKTWEITNNGELVKPAASSTSRDRHPKLQVKVERDDNYCQPQVEGVGIFETLEKRFSDVQKEATDIKSEPHNKINNHCWKWSLDKKRLKSPPPSPPLRQSKLTAESFSPKKRGAVICRCPMQEQPIPYTAPLYCTVPLRNSQQGAPDPTQNKFFTETQMNSLQALKEENFHQSVLTTVSSFMSQLREPPPTLVFYLLDTILLSKQGSCGKECFRILKQIQVLHPGVPEQMVRQKITWEFISTIFEQCSCSFNMHQSGRSDLAVNASLALAFLVSVMEDEVKVKTFSVVKTSAYRLLHVLKRANHIQDLITWIEGAILEHGSKQSIDGCQRDVCLVFLLQRMLVLSLTVSERPEDCASRISDEMIMAYCRLPSIELKSVLLQSMESHLLRAKLTELIVSNCCPLGQTELGDCVIPKEGLKNIVVIDFERSPPRLKDGVSAIASCEEFVMLLAYWLQSLVFCRKRSLQKNSSNSLRMLSMDDEDLLREIDQYVGKLRTRLENLCEASSLSQRSYQLLELISSLKSFAPKLP